MQLQFLGKSTVPLTQLKVSIRFCSAISRILQNSRLKSQKSGQNICQFQKKLYLCTRKRKQGTMAEWLGTGLQNLLQQFESAWYLNPRSTSQRVAPFFFGCFHHSTTLYFSQPRIPRVAAHFSLINHAHHGRKVHQRTTRFIL